MKYVMLALAFGIFLSACGKKAPLRAPDEPQEQSLRE